MSNVDFTNVANLLNKEVLPSVKVQIYKKAPMWEIFGGFQADERGLVESRVHAGTTPQVRFENNTIYVTVQTGRPAVGNTTTGGKFIYGTTPTDQGNLSIATSVGAFIMPKQVMNVKDGGAIVNTLQFNLDSTTNSMAMDLNRQCYQAGTATIGYAANSGTTTSITIQPKATGVVGTNWNGDIPLATRWLMIGLPLKIGSNSPTTVTAITGDNTFTVSDYQTLVAGTAIVKLDGDYVISHDVTGLAAIVGTADYMGITVSADATWKATVRNGNSGSPENFATNNLDNVYFAASVTGKPKIITMNRTNFQVYGESLTSNVRFDRKEALSGGWSALEYMGSNATVILDPDHTDDAVYVLDQEQLFRAEYQGLMFEPGTLGSGQRIAQTLNYEMVADWMGNLGCFLRSAHGAMLQQVGKPA